MLWLAWCGGRLVAGGGSCAVAGVLGVIGGVVVVGVVAGGVAGLVVGSFGCRWLVVARSVWDLLGPVRGWLCGERKSLVRV